jgi:5'(3')-deoxyribonucleotidase
MQEINEIYLDLDDVLNCFTGNVGCAFGLATSPDDLSWYKHECGFNIYEAVMLGMENRGIKLRMNFHEFWDSLKEDFWVACRVSNACYDLINKCVDLVGERNVFIATSPTKCPMAGSGKIAWINRKMPDWLSRQYFITPRKWKLSMHGRLLIDDSPENCERWRHAGGVAMLVPKPWSCENYQPHDDFHFLTKELPL